MKHSTLCTSYCKIQNFKTWPVLAADNNHQMYQKIESRHKRYTRSYLSPRYNLCHDKYSLSLTAVRAYGTMLQLSQARSQLDNWVGGGIHIFVFTDHKNNRFKKIICDEHEYMNMSPPIIEL